MNSILQGFQPSQSFSQLVNKEIAEDGQFHPNLGGITQGGMANHFPMTIMSLAGLGGSDEDIERFKSAWPRYRTRVVDLKLQDQNTLTLDNWTEFLGQTSFLLEFRRVFLSGIGKYGAADFVTRALAKMADGMPMGLFHPLIRLSFARMHGDPGLIADALAYFAIRYEDLYVSDVAYKDASTESAKEALVVWQELSQEISRGGIAVDLRGASLPVCEQLCGDAKLHELALKSGFHIDADNLRESMANICQAAIRLYLFEPALTTLHAVTSAQALADLTKAYANSDNEQVFVGLWRRYWIWLTGLFVEKGSPESVARMQYVSQEQLPSWDKIASAATTLNEVHAIKMVFSCKWLAEYVENNQLYQLAAVKLLNEHRVSW